MTPKIDPNSSLPLHSQAENYLRMLIEKEEYKNGKLLPNEVELSEQLKISRNTLRQAINKLVFEGLLTRKKGYGTKVAKKSILSGAKNWMSFSQEMRTMGIEVQNFELFIGKKRPNEEACTFFGLRSSDERILCLERLRGKKDFPFVYFISFFNPAIPLTGNENYALPLYEILETEHHIQVKTSKEEISACLAGNFISEKLEIAPDDPILVRKRFVYDVNDNPVEYNIGYYRADSFTYTIESQRG